MIQRTLEYTHNSNPTTFAFIVGCQITKAPQIPKHAPKIGTYGSKMDQIQVKSSIIPIHLLIRYTVFDPSTPRAFPHPSRSPQRDNQSRDSTVIHRDIHTDRLVYHTPYRSVIRRLHRTYKCINDPQGTSFLHPFHILDTSPLLNIPRL